MLRTAGVPLTAPLNTAEFKARRLFPLKDRSVFMSRESATIGAPKPGVWLCPSIIEKSLFKMRAQLGLRVAPIAGSVRPIKGVTKGVDILKNPK